MSHGDLVASDLLRGPQLSDELLLDLPKVDLHVHLDGSLRLSTFIELCTEHGHPIPGGSIERARELLSSQGGAQRLEDYIALF
jgi:adenosine deaminase